MVRWETACAGLGSWCCSSAVCWILVGWVSLGGSGSGGELESGVLESWSFCVSSPGISGLFSWGLAAFGIWGVGLLLLLIEKTCKYFQICVIGYGIKNCTKMIIYTPASFCIHSGYAICCLLFLVIT